MNDVSRNQEKFAVVMLQLTNLYDELDATSAEQLFARLDHQRKLFSGRVKTTLGNNAVQATYKHISRNMKY